MTARRITGIFPGLGYFDGIGRSGVAAWKGICGVPGVAPVLLTYGTHAPPKEVGGRVLFSRSQLGSVWNAMRAGGSAEVSLFWHVHLLRLLPFLRRPGKVVLYLHGIEVWRRLPASLRGQLRRVNLVLSNSDFTWQRFLEFNPEFASLPHAVVALGMDAPVEQAVPKPGSAPAALMIGRISRAEAYKGHDVVIAAWAEVQRRVPGAELHVIGPGDMYGDLRKLAEQCGVSENCHFHGTVSQERKEELLANARCMVLPSKGEGFGLAYVESMRVGRPCLVSLLDAGREVVNPPEGGLAVNPENHEELVAGLCRLLTEGAEWDGFSARTKARYEDRYTEAAFVRRLNTALGLA